MTVASLISHKNEHRQMGVLQDAVGAGIGASKNTIAIIGNSIAVQDTPITATSMLVTGCFLWANYMLGQRFDVVSSSTDLFAGYLGVSGDTSAQILNRVGSVIALKPKYCLMLGIIENDVNDGVATATTQANIILMLNALQRSGIIPIICTGIPSLLNDTATKANAYYSNNTFIKELYLNRAGIIVIDISNEFVDYAQTYPKPLATNVSSGPHPNSLGAYKVGKRIYNTLNSVIPPRPIFSNHYLSVANGGDTPDSAIDNPLVRGSSGTIVAPLTGVVADNWTGNATGATSGVGSKVVRADLPLLEWQQMSYTGDATYTYGSDYARIYSAIVTLPGADLAIGDNIQAFAEFEADGSDTNFLGAEIKVRCLNGSSEYFSGFERNATIAMPVGEDFPAGVLSSPKLTIPSGTTSLQLHLRAHASDVNAAFVVRFGRAIAHKI